MTAQSTTTAGTTPAVEIGKFTNYGLLGVQLAMMFSSIRHTAAAFSSLEKEGTPGFFGWVPAIAMDLGLLIITERLKKDPRNPLLWIAFVYFLFVVLMGQLDNSLAVYGFTVVKSAEWIAVKIILYSASFPILIAIVAEIRAGIARDNTPAPTPTVRVGNPANRRQIGGNKPRQLPGNRRPSLPANGANLPRQQPQNTPANVPTPAPRTPTPTLPTSPTLPPNQPANAAPKLGTNQPTQPAKPPTPTPPAQPKIKMGRGVKSGRSLFDIIPDDATEAEITAIFAYQNTGPDNENRSLRDAGASIGKSDEHVRLKIKALRERHPGFVEDVLGA